MTSTDRNDNWKISELWNELLTTERTLKPRDYIYASEIGQPFLDRYLKMKGIPYSNPFESRVLRVFDCGKIFEIDVVERIFKLLGILIESQGSIKVKYKDYLTVSGKHDPKVGGKIDVQKSDEALADPLVSDWMRDRVLKMRESLLKQYPNGLRVLTTEIKSVNSRAFWSHKNIDELTGFFKGYDHHKLQLFTYLIGQNQPEGRLFYISKDDLTLMETTVLRDDKQLLKTWEDDVSQMTHFYKNNIEPPKEPDFVFNTTKGEYEFNWLIKRSNYFSHITKFKTVSDWEFSLKNKLKELNSSKCKKCDKSFLSKTLNKNNGFCGKCIKSL